MERRQKWEYKIKFKKMIKTGETFSELKTKSF